MNATQGVRIESASSAAGKERKGTLSCGLPPLEQSLKRGPGSRSQRIVIDAVSLSVLVNTRSSECEMPDQDMRSDTHSRDVWFPGRLTRRPRACTANPGRHRQCQFTTVNDEIHPPMGGVRDSGWGRTGPKASPISQTSSGSSHALANASFPSNEAQR